MRNVKVSAIQMQCAKDVATNIQTAERLVRQAAEQGAQIILLPELFERPYFCQERQYDYYQHAQSVIENTAIQHFKTIAKELKVVLPISFYEKDGNVLYNSIAVIDADGEVLGVYRKTHIPDDHYYQEKFYFTPGNTGFKVWDTRYAKIGIGICWDQWFPETARCLALNGAELLFYPTAIGSEPVAPDFIKVSLDETNRMMRMVTDLLHLSRIDNTTSHLDVELINFTAFITFILNRFDTIKSQDDQQKYELVRDYPITSVWIEIDTDKMTQVIDNILNNAIKYSPDGGKITVSMKTTDEQMILSISDQGLGIPKQDLPRIFDRFYRVDRARSRAQGGTGLGLSIAKEIIKQHKGFIWAKSEYGKGSTFTIVLPYDKYAVKEEVWEDEVED